MLAPTALSPWLHVISKWLVILKMTSNNRGSEKGESPKIMKIWGIFALQWMLNHIQASQADKEVS